MLTGRGEGTESPVGLPQPEANAGSDLANLVKAAASGEKAAWDQLVDRFAGTVWAVARGHRLSAADASEVSQTTWLRLVENLDRIQEPDRVGAWLAATARRESLRLIRLAGRQVPSGEDLESLPDPAPVETNDLNFSAAHRDRVLSELVAQLPIRSQLLLRLLGSDSPLSYKDISESLDIPMGSIGPTRARALDHLQRLADKAGIDLTDPPG